MPVIKQMSIMVRIILSKYEKNLLTILPASLPESLTSLDQLTLFFGVLFWSFLFNIGFSFHKIIIALRQ